MTQTTIPCLLKHNDTHSVKSNPTDSFIFVHGFQTFVSEIQETKCHPMYINRRYLNSAIQVYAQ